MGDSATVFVVDDDPAVRDSLQWLIGSVGLIVRTFASAAELFAELADEPPACLVLDVRLPGMSGLELHEQLAARGMSIPTVMITGHGDVPMAVRAMKLGAIDFIEKPFSDQLLIDRIRTAIALDGEQRRDVRKQRDVRKKFDSLTKREKQVLDRVVRGRLNKQIAEELGLSQKTVEVHRARVMEKMRAGSLAELVRMVVTTRQADQATA